MKEIEWFGCYADSWQGEIVPDAFSHPAKFSRALIARIYDHMIDSGYIKPGDTVGDPFGGVALGAIHAMLKGLHWRGCELEQKFVDLGGQNIALWQSRYGEMLSGTAVLVQGDSREFMRHVAGIGAIVSSSPYASGEKGHPSLGSVNKDGWGIDGRDIAARRGVNGRYGDSSAQLANLPEGDLSAVVSSPAYADVINGSGEGPGVRYDHVHHNGDNATKKTSTAEYGRTAGNLGNLAAVVSSAPFESSLNNSVERSGLESHGKPTDKSKQNHNYGEDPANIGNDTGATFWQAAAVIVAQAYQALRPGAYAAWVCGDYVRDGERVYFGRQWLELCESVGFTGVEWITAWKTEYKGTQLDIFGNAHDKRIDRVSFFRRLANERNPDAAILNEDVIIVRKEAS